MSSGRLDRLTRVVIAVALLALLVRLVGLGWRVAHWDEARVAYWVLRANESGRWAYRPIIHGPFVQHAAGLLFRVLGRSDAVMRLPVALLGGLVPLAALLFRDRLDELETALLAVVLAADPLLVYYSRFFRSDVPLAVFALVAFGATLRAADTGRRRYGVLAAGSLALAFTTKENAVLYLACWAGAGALVAGWLVWRGRLSLPDSGRVAAVARRWAPTALVGVGLFLVTIVVLYAPRGQGLEWQALLRAATVGSAQSLVDLWVLGGLNGGLATYPVFFGHYVGILLLTGLATVVGTAVAVAVARERPLVAVCVLWGAASVVGYPYVNDLKAPWSVVHATVAFAIPAAVGLAWLGRRAIAREGSPLDRPTVLPGRRRTAVIAVVVLLGVHGAAATAVFSYAPPFPENVVAQGAQPTGDLAPLRHELPAIAATTEGPDVLFYGRYAVADERENRQPPAAANWYNRLPMPWYTERADATVVSATDPAGLANPPPIVVAPAERRAEVAPHLPGYEASEHALLRHGEDRVYRFGPLTVPVSGERVVVFVDRSARSSATAVQFIR